MKAKYNGNISLQYGGETGETYSTHKEMVFIYMYFSPKILEIIWEIYVYVGERY